jgi:hypothetical protein
VKGSEVNLYGCPYSHAAQSISFLEWRVHEDTLVHTKETKKSFLRPVGAFGDGTQAGGVVVTVAGVYADAQEVRSAQKLIKNVGHADAGEGPVV